MTTSRVIVDSATPPASVTGAGGAGSRHGKAKSAAGPDGFAALLDSMSRPTRTAPAAAPKAAAASTAEVRPSEPSPTGPSQASLTAEPGTDEQKLDAENNAPDTAATPVIVASVPLIEPVIVVNGQAAALATATAAPTPADGGTPSPVDAAITPSTAAGGVDGAVPLAGAIEPETAPGIDTPVAAELPEDHTTDDVISTAPQPDAKSRVESGWHAATAAPSSRTKTAEMVGPPEAAPAAAPAADVNAAGAVASNHAAPTGHAAAGRDDAARPRPSAQDAPPKGAGAPALQQALEPAPAGFQSQTAGEGSGQGSSSRGFSPSQSGQANGIGSSSERAAANFVVTLPVGDTVSSGTDAAASAAAPDAGLAADVREAGVENQLVQTMRTLWRGGIGEARVTLRPEYLGAVTISLRLEGGGLQAHLRVEDPKVAAWVQANEQLLKNGLAGQGLTLERLVVSDESGARDQRGQSREGERRESPRRGPRDSDTAQFTIDV